MKEFILVTDIKGRVVHVVLDSVVAFLAPYDKDEEVVCMNCGQTERKHYGWDRHGVIQASGINIGLAEGEYRPALNKWVNFLQDRGLDAPVGHGLGTL